MDAPIKYYDQTYLLTIYNKVRYQFVVNYHSNNDLFIIKNFEFFGCRLCRYEFFVYKINTFYIKLWFNLTCTMCILVLTYSILSTNYCFNQGRITA